MQEHQRKIPYHRELVEVSHTHVSTMNVMEVALVKTIEQANL
jgi:hypothetical protein